jgi:F0F1-type ATP synthase membrane subunit c/vacuolar-type H+-ATPase subunit K
MGDETGVVMLLVRTSVVNAEPKQTDVEMRKLFEIGGLVTAVVLIAFGVVAIVMGVNGRSTVQSSLSQEQIAGTPDMTPSGIAAEVKADQASQTKLVASMKAVGVSVTPSPITTPTCSIAGVTVSSGASARCFAQYMRVHTFAASSGLVYAQMGRFQAKPSTPLKATDGAGGTSDPKFAALDPLTKQPLDNGRRNTWVTYTAITTALNTSYMASQLALFGIVVGFALLLSGIGFGVLAIGGALRNPETVLKALRPRTAAKTSAPVTSV